ncbi:PE domain-containing protein [Pseudonocardia sp. C8]|nr:PE domain-containing protein [Pseudonocardia sp. C8]
MTQVGPENVLAVHALLRAQAESMAAALRAANWLQAIPRCGDDVVSVDAQALFQQKINAILDVHHAHVDEIREAADRLREAALQYRYTESDIIGALAPAREQLGLPGA